MKFCFGPLSTEIIEAIYDYSHYWSEELMLIASKNQIDYNRGYVNNWNTEEYVDFLKEMKQKYTKSMITVCRDHCGPSKKYRSNLGDVYRTIKTDIACNFDIIHVDLCYYGYKRSVVKKTCTILDFIRKKDSNIKFEIGTDEIGVTNKTQNDIKNEIDIFHKYNPVYYVVNSGSLVKENKQVGSFNKLFINDIHDYLNKQYGIGLKEHNADYLSSNQIALRKNKVDALNIAPQLGTTQTITVLSEAIKYGINIDDFVNLVYNNKRWEKWERKNTKNLTNNPYLSTIVAGHYHYTSDEYKKLIDKISKYKHNFSIYLKIKRNIQEIIDHYTKSLSC